MEQDRAEVELTIQIGAETEGEALAVLTVARKRARAMLAGEQKPEDMQEEQWCAAAMRVTVRRPHLTKTPA